MKIRGSSSHMLREGGGVSLGEWYEEVWGRVGEVRFYEGVEFLGAIDLDVGDVGVGVGEVEVFVGGGWGLVFCHCGWECGLILGYAEGRNSCLCRALPVKPSRRNEFGFLLVFFVSRGG